MAEASNTTLEGMKADFGRELVNGGFIIHNIGSVLIFFHLGTKATRYER